jgi:hypothetical protein
MKQSTDGLPQIRMTLRLIDPTWKAVFADGSPKAINTDTMYKEYEIMVDIVQLNLNSGGMRIRYEWPSKYTKRGFEICTQDVSIDHFFKHFNIEQK